MEQLKILAKLLKNVCGRFHFSKVAALGRTNLLKDELRKLYISKILLRLKATGFDISEFQNQLYPRANFSYSS